MTALTIIPKASIAKRDWQTFDDITEAVKATVAKSSQRVYAQTFGAWADFCDANGLSPLALYPVNVAAFLSSGNTAYTTRRSQLSALRMLARMLSAMSRNADYQTMYNTLKMIRAPHPATDGSVAGGHKREMRALPPEDVRKVLTVWNESSPLHRRNRALVALLFATGIRRAEAAAIRWDDLHLDDGTLTIRQGKGGKSREVAIFGDFATRALSSWKTFSGPDRVYVFCQINKGKPGKDQPMHPQGVYRAVVHTEKISGVKVKPHDARRTVITSLLTNNVPMAEVQAQAGHANANTTMRYAYAVDAKRRRKDYKLTYG